MSLICRMTIYDFDELLSKDSVFDQWMTSELPTQMFRLDLNQVTN